MISAATLLLLSSVLFLLQPLGAFAPSPSFASSLRGSTSFRSTSFGLRMSSTPFELNPKETALVLIEYQNEFASEGGKLHEAVKDVMLKTNMLANSKKVVDEMRRAGCTIIHCPISFEPGHHEISSNIYGILAGVKDGQAFVSGEWGADFCEAMKPQNGDLVVKGKSGLCGFQSTNLDFLLRQKGCHNVVLGGFLTNCCVESTMRTAYEKGYKVLTLTDCVAATSKEAQDATLQYNFGMFSIVTTSADVIQALSTVSAT